jgi:capsular exopolysaccharide synthesis family protein
MDPLYQHEEEKGQDLFSYLLYRFAPYWPLFILLMLVSAAGGWLYLQHASPLYDAEATILLKDEKKGVDDAKILEALNIYNTTKIVENEMEVIRSRALMMNVVKKLDLFASIYEKGNLRDNIAYSSSPIVVDARNPTALAKSDKIEFYYDKRNKTVHIDGKQFALDRWYKTPYGELSFEENPELTTPTDKELYFVLDNPESVTSAMVNRLSVRPTNKISTVLNLTYSDESPERAKDILNELIKNYQNRAIDEKNDFASKTLAFIEKRLGYLVKDIDSIERSIQVYKSQEGIVNLSEEGKVFLQNVGDNDRQIGTINMKLAALDQVEKYVRAKNNDAGIVPSTLEIDDDVLVRLLQKLYDNELQYEKLKKTMGENSPTVASLYNEIETIRPAILENINSHKASLVAARENIINTNGQYATLIRTIPQKEKKLLEISREQSIKNSVYSFLLQKREETALSASSKVPDSRLIDSATASPLPVSPKKSYVYIAALLAAMLIGIAIVAGKEFLSGKILFRADIEKSTKVPIAAEISSIRIKSDPLVVNNPNKQVTAEQFRQLRAAIGLYGRKVPNQKILVTSTIAGEGKSFIASNLALSLAISGKKVVLVDADFRRPKTSVTFSVENVTGFSDYLKNEIGLKTLIRETAYNNLFIVPAGTETVNPTEALLNGNLNELFDFLHLHFDFVVVDTSPVAPVTDAYVLSDYCDKTLFVIRHGYTPKTMVKMLDENSRIKVLKNLFIVFNGVKKRGFIKGSYGFGYGFGYDYVYKERQGLRRSKA